MVFSTRSFRQRQNFTTISNCKRHLLVRHHIGPYTVMYGGYVPDIGRITTNFPPPAGREDASRWPEGHRFLPHPLELLPSSILPPFRHFRKMTGSGKDNLPMGRHTHASKYRKRSVAGLWIFIGKFGVDEMSRGSCERFEGSAISKIFVRFYPFFIDSSSFRFRRHLSLFDTRLFFVGSGRVSYIVGFIFRKLVFNAFSEFFRVRRNLIAFLMRAWFEFLRTFLVNLYSDSKVSHRIIRHRGGCCFNDGSCDMTQDKAYVYRRWQDIRDVIKQDNNWFMCPMHRNGISNVART